MSKEYVNSAKFYKDAVDWDVATWKPALNFWDKYLQKNPPAQDALGLEVGANRGGLSLYFAAKHNIHMICSDYGGPSHIAHDTHNRYGVGRMIEYKDVNALDMPFEDNKFDYVVFKSILGVVAKTPEDTFIIENQQKAIQEMHRVLKPGGALFFAENLKASPIHKFLRKKFIPWGGRWRYVNVKEMNEFLKPFSEVESRTFGFFNAFIRNEGLKKLAIPVEKTVNIFMPKSYNYIMYGVAVK